jgi:Amt family ammonium transporter
MLAQLIGVAVCGLTAAGLSFTIFFIMNKTIGLRIDKEMEDSGIDQIEHGISAYISL